MNQYIQLFWIALTGGMLLTTGCGKPVPPDMAPPPDAPAMAVVGQVLQQTIEDQMDLVATLEPKEEITVVSEISARIIAVGFSEGETIKKGQLLFRLDAVSSSARLKEAVSAYKLAELSYKRNKELLQSQTVSQQELDQAEAEYHSRQASLALAEDQQSKTTIHAPFAGTLGERLVSAGQYVNVGQQLTQLMQVDPMEIVFNVPERYMSSLEKGLTVHFASAAFPENDFSGVVVYIAPSLDPATRSVRVKADIANPEGQLKPGMFGRLSLVFESRENGLVIPESAIQFNGDMTLVVKVNAEGRSEFAPVQVGQRFKKQAEILSGLQAGDWVVVEGFQKMGPGMLVIAAPGSAAYGVTPGPLAPPKEETPPAEEAAPDAAQAEGA